MLCIVVLCVACGAALYQGVRATGDLRWPADEDFARDVAAAESIAAGHLLSDPVYRGEWMWYNPLAPSIVAAVAVASDRPIPLIYARLGAYFNVLAPVALFALVTVWWGWLTGLVAALALLYLVPGEGPGWLTASYSPLFYPMHVGQACFYLALLAITYAWRTGRARAFAIAGCAFGATLLAHTAPTLLLTGAMAAETLRTEWRHPAERPHRLICYLVFVGAAAAVAAPFLASIVGHYHLNIKNAGPGVYLLGDVLIEHARELWKPVITPSLVWLVTVAGLVQLLRRRHELEARLILSTAATAGAFLMYGYLTQTQWAMSHRLITIVPTHHFWYYLTALTAIVFACGVRAIASGIEWLGARAGNRQLAHYAMPAVTGLVLVAAIFRYPDLARRFDFAKAPTTSRDMFTDRDLSTMYEWLRTSTSRDDVFLAPVNLGQSVIGLAGRKVVVVGKFFSNPYVNWGARAEDNLAMDRYLRLGDFDGFLALASKYRVRYIARVGRLPDELLKQPLLSTAWSSGPWVIYKLGR